MTEALSCERFFAFMRAYRDGELPDAVRAAFEAHIDACPPCVDYLDGYGRSVELARRCAAADADADGPGRPPEALITAILGAMSTATDDD